MAKFDIIPLGLMAPNGPVKPMFEILMIVMKYSISNVQEGYDVIEPRDVGRKHTWIEYYSAFTVQAIYVKVIREVSV